MRLIDADAVILSLQVIKAKNHMHLGKWENEFIDAFIAGIDEFAEKEAQPQRMNGKWVQISPAKIYECSICGKNVMTEDIDAYDFCHGCGADMRGEQNG